MPAERRAAGTLSTAPRRAGSGAVILLFLLLFWAGAGAGATPKVDQTTAYYDIHGFTSEELRREMNAKRPADSNGKRYDEVTTWQVRWTYRHRNTKER